MKTRKFCPHCGRSVVRSRTPGNAFQCHACDEDFYRFEMLNTRRIPLMRGLRRIERERKLNPDGEVGTSSSADRYSPIMATPDLPNKEETKIITCELTEYWGVSGGLKQE